MKLESLKNSKYSLTPEKMGKLVGGEVCCETTGGGTIGNFANCSCDVSCHYSGDDVPVDANGLPKPTTIIPLQGKNDMKYQSLIISQYGSCK